MNFVDEKFFKSHVSWVNSLCINESYKGATQKHSIRLFLDAYRSLSIFDMEIKCKDGTVEANSASLISRSKVFATMMSGDFKELPFDSISLPTDTTMEVIDMLEYITSGVVPTYLKEFAMNNIERATRLYDLSARFEIEGLVFETKIFKIKNLHFITDIFFESYGGFDPEVFPDTGVESNLRHYSNEDNAENYCILRIFKKLLSRRFSCKVFLILEDSKNPKESDIFRLIYHTQDGSELHTFKIQKKYKEICKEIMKLK